MVWALIDYLDHHSPPVMARVRAENPELSELSSGRQLGPSVGKADVYADIAKSALEIAENKIDSMSAYLKTRMMRAARWRMISSITAAVSTAGLVGALLVNARIAAIVTASVNVIASIVSILTQQFENSFLGQGPNAYELFKKLVSLAARVVGLRNELTLAEISNFSEDELLELTRKANALVAELHEVEFTVFPEMKFGT